MNTHTFHSRRLGAVIALLGAGLLVAGPASAHAINGAIFTSKADGTTVNGNLYDTRQEVYLNGGPSNPPVCNGGDLDDGDYYFQVTDPSGSTLLSTDGIAERAFRVIGGRIEVNLGSHLDADDDPNDGVERSACGSLSIQLFPFDFTPNNGGEYKVWITRISDFELSCGVGVDCGLAGFVPGHTKTDNFKVRERNPGPGGDPDTGDLSASKFFDANANCAWDGGEPALAGWQMTIDPLDGAPEPQTQLTDAAGIVTWTNLDPDLYAVTEGIPNELNWVQSAPTDGECLVDPPSNPVIGLEVVENEVTSVTFGNFCLVGSGGKTLGFWSNKNGERTMNDGGTLAPELALLSSFNLRSANGTHFNPTLYTGFRTWLLSATATNMAYMLSAQLAAMVLNVEAGFVDGGAFYIPFGGTIDELVADANALLSDATCGNPCITTAASNPSLRADQEALKDFLDQLNNGADVIPSDPSVCPFTFPEPELESVEP